MIFLLVPAAFIRERRLFEGGVYSNNYGSYWLGLASKKTGHSFMHSKNAQCKSVEWTSCEDATFLIHRSRVQISLANTCE